MSEHLESRFVRVAITGTVGAYLTGQCVGGLLTFTAGLNNLTAKGIITSVKIVDQAAQGAAYDLVLFSSAPSSTTFTDNATLDIADNDMAKIVAVVNLATTDYFAFADNGLSYKGNLAIPVYETVYTGSLYGALVIRSSATFAATTDLAVSLALLSD